MVPPTLGVVGVWFVFGFVCFCFRVLCVSFVLFVVFLFFIFLSLFASSSLLVLLLLLSFLSLCCLRQLLIASSLFELR